MDEPVTARSAAEAAAEAVRTLNHLTGSPPAVWTPGWDEFADVYAIAVELQVLAQRLPQAFGQLAAVFDDPAVVFAADNDNHPADVIAAARHGLIDASSHAEALRAALERAHGALSHLYVDGHVVVDDAVGSSRDRLRTEDSGSLSPDRGQSGDLEQPDQRRPRGPARRPPELRGTSARMRW